MKIKLTDEQMHEILSDGVIDIRSDSGFSIYCEISTDGSFQYGEYYPPRPWKDRSFWVDMDDIKRKTPTRLRDPSYYSNDPLCPSCGTYMIYNFDYCPKCGQKIDYSKDIGA